MTVLTLNRHCYLALYPRVATEYAIIPFLLSFLLHIPTSLQLRPDNPILSYTPYLLTFPIYIQLL